jgi:hypothetical protein
MKDKSVTMIGSGSSGIHAVPTILPDVMWINHYVREMNLLGSAFGRDDIESESKGKWGLCIHRVREDAVEYCRAIDDNMNGVGVVFSNCKEQAEDSKYTKAPMQQRPKEAPRLWIVYDLNSHPIASACPLDLVIERLLHHPKSTQSLGSRIVTNMETTPLTA